MNHFKGFTNAGKALSKDIRVLINGQVFGAKRKCHSDAPGKMPWEGQLIRNSALVPGGDPPSKPANRFIGRQNAIPEWRYFVGRGDPSNNNPALAHAMGSLLPLIEGGVPFGCENLGTPPNVRQRFSPTTCELLKKWGDSIGKTLVGLHRTSGCLFVICQEYGLVYGAGDVSLKSILKRLMTMGVSDTVICDSSTSATLIVDRTIHAEPRKAKNNSIPTGLMFRLQPILFRSGGTFTVGFGTTDIPFKNSFPVGTVLLEVKGSITVTSKTAGGLDLSISSFGVNLPAWPAARVAREMGVNSLPITLTTTSTDLTAGVTFSSKSPNVKLLLRVTRSAGNPDTLRGTLTVKVSGGTAANPRGTVIGVVIVPI